MNAFKDELSTNRDAPISVRAGFQSKTGTHSEKNGFGASLFEANIFCHSYCKGMDRFSTHFH